MLKRFIVGVAMLLMAGQAAFGCGGHGGGGGRGGCGGGGASFGGCGMSSGGASFGGCGTVVYGSSDSCGSGSCPASNPTTAPTQAPVLQGNPTSAPVLPHPLPPVPTPSTSQMRFNLNVPADAVVWLNGHQTTTTGTDRTYISYGEVGRTYKYVIQVQVYRDGRWLQQTQTTVVSPNQITQYAFDPKEPVSAPKTMLVSGN